MPKTQTKQQLISWDDFVEKYEPQENHLDDNASYDGLMYETYEKELDYIFGLHKHPLEKGRVWTIIEGDNDKIYIEAGFHLVNRMGFIVTKKHWEHSNITVEDD